MNERKRGMGVSRKITPKKARHKFAVKLAWLTVIVKAYTFPDAIKKARKSFCDSWPRHRGMIHFSPDSEFDVKVIGGRSRGT